jgi:hypothetical protein
MIVNKDNLLVLKVFLTCFEGFDLRNYLFIYFFGCCSAHNLVTTCFHRVSIFFLIKIECQIGLTQTQLVIFSFC